MTDMEKVIKGLEQFKADLKPFCGNRADWERFDAGFALPKEQNAIEPKTGHWIYKKYDDMFMCSRCEKYSIRNDYPYCHWCGAKMDDEVESR